MTLFITSDTLFHNQKYFLALVLKANLLPHNQLLHNLLLSSRCMSSTPHTPPMCLQTDRSTVKIVTTKACYITEAEEVQSQVTFNTSAREVVMKQK